MLPFYDICRRRPQMSEQKGKSVKNKELIKEKIISNYKERTKLYRALHQLLQEVLL